VLFGSLSLFDDIPQAFCTLSQNGGLGHLIGKALVLCQLAQGILCRVVGSKIQVLAHSGQITNTRIAQIVWVEGRVMTTPKGTTA
jgi:hypothetical protein